MAPLPRCESKMRCRQMNQTINQQTYREVIMTDLITIMMCISLIPDPSEVYHIRI
jgi:hypothetical protein